MDLSKTEPAAALLDQIIAPANWGNRFLRSHSHWLQLFPPQAIEWNRLDLPLPAGLAGLRILHLSDFHFRRHWPPAMDLLLERIHRDPPDLVLLTGDFVESKGNHRPAMPHVRRMIEGLTARAGCFAIHGNHDNYAIGRELRESHVTFLDGRRHVLDTTCGKVELIGLPGRRRTELTQRFLRSLPPAQTDIPRIVLSHFPDHLARTGGLGACLFLAGHTHGGQMCLPGGQPLMWHDSLPRKLARGAHRVGNTWLVVSRGLGYTGLPIRMFSTPEVIEIRSRV